MLIRCDDIGMCQAVNEAAKKVLDTGIPVSMSVMVPCPWFTQAATMLKQYPNVSIGIHLTLNSEWKNYRWGPVAGASTVPSLVDSLGNFFPSRSQLFNNNPSLVEIETELRAQIDLALKAGLKLDYLDYHMGAAVQTPSTRAIVEKLASEYNLSISRYYGEVDVEGGYSAPVDSKLDTIMSKVQTMPTGNIGLMVFHVGLNTPEMAAMIDLNPFGPAEMSRHREAELHALLSPSFLQLIKDQQIKLVNYKELNKSIGQQNMIRPVQR